jgi:CBS domain-containing protein
MTTTEQRLLRLTQIIRSPLADQAGEPIGRIEDVVVRLGSDVHPPLVGLQVRLSGRQVFVPIGQVADLTPGRARMTGDTVNLKRFERREREVLLRQDILDRKVIQIEAGRLIPAADIALGATGTGWSVVGIDVRSGPFLQRVLRRTTQRPLDRAAIVDWSHIEPFVGHVPTAKRRLPLQRLRRLHPAQIADLVEAASHEEGNEIITAVGADPELEADVFEELDTGHQREFLEDRSDSEAAEVLGTMSPDDAADLLGELPQERRAPILARLPAEEQAKVRRLLAYNPGTAGGLMTPEFVAVDQHTTVAQALQQVTQASRKVLAVHLTDAEQRFIGSLSLHALLLAPRDSEVRDTGDLIAARLRVDADFTSVALLMADYNLTEAPVVDAEDHLVGAISVDDVLEALIPDHWRRRDDGIVG